MNEIDVLCPFSQAKCLENRCKLWIRFDRAAPGVLPGMVKNERIHDCAFIIQVVVTAAIANRPPMMIPGPLAPNIKGG